MTIAAAARGPHRARRRASPEPAEVLDGPTQERLALAGDLIEMPEVGQRRVLRAYRVVSVVVQLHRDGRIDDACLAAHARFESDWQCGETRRPVTSRYDDRVPGGDTDETEHAELRRLRCRNRAWQALSDIPSAHGRRALEMSVASRPADAISTVRPYTIEDIGRACGFRNRAQAIAAGVATLREALHQLQAHYDKR